MLAAALLLTEALSSTGAFAASAVARAPQAGAQAMAVRENANGSPLDTAAAPPPVKARPARAAEAAPTRTGVQLAANTPRPPPANDAIGSILDAAISPAELAAPMAPIAPPVATNKLQPIDGDDDFIGTLLAQASPATITGDQFRAPAAPAAPQVAVPVPVAPRRLNPTGRDINLTGALKDAAGDAPLGDIAFVMGADDSVRLNTQDLLAALKPLLQDASLTQLRTAIGGDRTVSAARLAQQGYAVTYDPATISLSISVPVQARLRRALSLMDLNPNNGTFDKPANLSAYLNARGSLDYVEKGFDAGSTDAMILLDGAVRTHGVVLESEGSYENNSSGSQLRREGTRAVYDRLDRTERWTVGDLLPTGRGFSGAPTMAGISVLKSYSVLDPQRNVQPRGDHSFTVVRPSTVEAFINGRSVRQIRLQPGTYDLSDFPFTQGGNDVRLVVTDDAGRQEVTQFSLFFDRTLLEPGLAEYGFFAGAYAPYTATSRDYHFNDPRASGFYRRGINERLTAGANFNASKNGSVLGAEGLWASPIGTFGIDLAGSQHKGAGTGYAINTSYNVTIHANAESGLNPVVSLVFETRNLDFATPDETPGVYPYAYEVGASYSQPLGDRQYFALDARHAAGRRINPDQDSYRFIYGNRLTDRLNVQVEAKQESLFGRENTGGRVSLLYRLGARTSATAEYDSTDDRGRIGLQTSQGRGVGAWSASGDIDYGRGQAGLDAAFNQSMNRFEYGLNHRTSFSNDGQTITDSRTSLRASGALVYADGQFGMSRPVYDSFVMVAPHETIKDKTVIIEPEKDYYLAKSDRLGPAILPEVSAFSPRTITYDVPDAPAGYDFGSGTTRVLPPYRAGYLTIAGSDYSMTAIGRLLNDEGKPISLIAGQASEVGVSGREPVMVFTNRDGRFGAAGLRPGTWLIRMPGDTPLEYKMVIPKGATGVVRLGDLKPEETP